MLWCAGVWWRWCGTHRLRGWRRGRRRSPSSSLSSPRRRGPGAPRRRSSLRSVPSPISSTTATRGTHSSSSIGFGVCGAPIRRWRCRHHSTHELMLSRILKLNDPASEKSTASRPRYLVVIFQNVSVFGSHHTLT